MNTSNLDSAAIEAFEREDFAAAREHWRHAADAATWMR